VDDLADERALRWWADRPPLQTRSQAREFVDDLGFCLLFGGRDARYPSLREASRDDSKPRLPSGWGDDLEAMWTWKDEMPPHGEAWLGRYLSGKQTLIATDLLADLYEFDGQPDDFRSAPGLTPVAVRLAEHLQHEGPTSTRVLRAVSGASAKAVDKAVAELGRLLLVTNYGVQEDGGGWASCVLELTARAFTVPGPAERAQRDAAAAARFVDTMIEARPIDICRAFKWSRDRAVSALAAVGPEPLRSAQTSSRGGRRAP
jgi:hypothetical protein